MQRQICSIFAAQPVRLIERAQSFISRPTRYAKNEASEPADLVVGEAA